MVVINLLPWRQNTYRYQQQRMRKMLLVSALFAVALVISVHVMLSIYTADLLLSVENLQSQIINDQAAIKKRQLPLNQIKNTATKNIAGQNLWWALGNSKEKNVCFSAITRTGQQTSFSGYTRSAIDLTNFLRHWQAANLFSEIRIQELQHLPDRGLIKFRWQAIDMPSHNNEVNKNAI